MIDTIYLDMDDVCNRFTMYALQEMGCGPMAYEEKHYPIECGFDIVAACNRLHPTKKDWSLQSFWNSVKRHLWATVPESLEFRRLLNSCSKLVGKDRVILLTSPTLCPDSLAGKLEWIQAFCPPWMHRQYLIGPVKWSCARPGALLIDDADKNIRSFRKAGGEAILVPRPWNSLECIAESTPEYIEAMLRSYREAN